jgi:tRNA A37 N6-isopentenylltransferase MiaA
MLTPEQARAVFNDCNRRIEEAKKEIKYARRQLRWTQKYNCPHYNCDIIEVDGEPELICADCGY